MRHEGPELLQKTNQNIHHRGTSDLGSMIYPQSVVYAIEALGYLVSLPQDTSAKAKEISTALNIPEHFLGKVLTELVKKKFVASTKGPSGGFRLNVDPTKVTLYRVLAALDGLSRLEDDCVMGLDTCTSDAPCALHDQWQTFKETAVYKAQQLPLSELSKIVMAKTILQKASPPRGKER